MSAVPPDMPRVFAVTDLKLPQTPLEHAIDLNGDERPDNRLGFLIAAVMGQGFDLQASVGAAISHGAPVLLLAFDYRQDTHTRDEPIEVVLTVARPTDRTMTTFVADAGVPPVTIKGRLSGAVFDSEGLTSGGMVASARLPLPIFAGHPLDLTARPTLMRFTIAAGSAGLSAGRLCGAMEPAGLAEQFGVGLAAEMTRFIASEPESPRARQISQLFDTGGCTNRDGAVAAAGDHIISPCELAASPLFRALIAPDVHLFDAHGSYSPSVTLPNDSVSFGFGFTAHPAAIAPPH
jgi:hypothetical protein